MKPKDFKPDENIKSGQHFDVEQKQKKFYEFAQNNSGGNFIVDENLCQRIIIEAEYEESAIEKAEDLGCYWNGVEDGRDCSCCGDRWYRSADEVDLAKIKGNNGYNIGIYSHYKNPEERWLNLYGKFPRFTEPIWKEICGTEIFQARIYFDTIEQYAQFMANEYAMTNPDVRIFFADGSKKEFFTVVVGDK
jgi:hypothetical protein